jgi:hypothetical protein
MSPTVLRVIAAVSVSAAIGFLAARHRLGGRGATSVLWPGAKELHVPHVQGSITLDGDTDDSGWRGPTARTGPFVRDDGVTPAHPHSEARIVWGDGFLYLNLYAADEDIRAIGTTPDSLSPEEDSFHLVFTDATLERIIDVNPLGIITDAIHPVGSSALPDLSWDSHLHVSHELDGTPNKPHDNDEEWVLEIAIPFESLGITGKPGERLGFAMHRCDTPHDGKRVCGSWGETAAHAVLVLE